MHQTEIAVLEERKQISKMLDTTLRKEGCVVTTYVTTEFRKALQSIPSIIVINEDEIRVDAEALCTRIRKENLMIPILVVSSSCSTERVLKVLQAGATQYINQYTRLSTFLYQTIVNWIQILEHNRAASPLTGLPGNLQIEMQIEKQLQEDKEFAVLYADLDHFKAYNDLYGFLKGNEMIQCAANTIRKSVPKSAFVGHIGGDDFVVIAEKDNYAQICQDIISAFDKEVVSLFSEEELKNDYMKVLNRKGIVEEIPLTSLSIGVVIVTTPGRYQTVLEIANVGAEVKHYAKTMPGSSYFINRRK